MVPKSTPEIHTFRDPAFYVDFMLNLAHFWIPLTHILILFGSLLAPFWLHLARLWLPFGALGRTFAHPCSQFSHFGGVLASFFIFVCIFD